MKLSDAILLGSTVLTPKAGGQHFAENRAGCALGMAAIAKGCTFRRVTRPFPLKDRRTLGTEGVWGDWVLTVVARPCRCWRLFVPREMRIKDIIAHLFDHHVVAKKNWTLDQLVAWVKTVEPDGFAPQPVTISRVLPVGVVPRWQEIAEWQRVREAFEARHRDRTVRLRKDSTPVESS